MDRTIKIGAVAKDQFGVFAIDNTNKLTGLVSFQVSTWNNSTEINLPVTITEIDDSGEYCIEFTPTTIGILKIEIMIPENGDAIGFQYSVEEQSQGETAADIKRLLGLSHENMVIDLCEYDGNSQLVQARVRIFNSRNNCLAATPGGSETAGLVCSYSISTIWGALNQFEIFRQVTSQ